ncbi:helix-turn-helix transcriptional regulator [Serratia rhizosphaerae]|uniref:helix-turn-helix transcriptional regulator n=1 Tax=Serratia rhizosphaerae TaxID=2597702 RepID=UPI002DB6705E|nr:helix-turn-helix domain-containing protein [Serratia rhizosphaerae]MEB6334643.1 helix-turn-helix domain-containing protein [Serratia rhizosphaerae]
MKRVITEDVIERLHALSPDVPVEMLISWESSDDAWFLKDENSMPIYANAEYSQLMVRGNQGSSSILSPFKPFITLHDRRVIEELRKIEAVGILPVNTHKTLSVFYCERMPYYDHHAHLSGIISHIKPLSIFTPRFFISGEEMGWLTTNCPTTLFSKKEWEVIFLILQGMPEKDIADTVHRTVRTIKFHKNNILAKSHCETTREFISESRGKKWDLYIPPLFSNPCYIIRG